MSMMHHLYHSCNSITLTVHSHTTHTHAYLGGQYSTLPLEHASMAQAWTNHDPSSCYIKLIDLEVAVIAPPKSSRGAKKFFQNIFVIIICQALALTPTKICQALALELHSYHLTICQALALTTTKVQPTTLVAHNTRVTLPNTSSNMQTY